jgi:hypothetical protein
LAWSELDLNQKVEAMDVISALYIDLLIIKMNVVILIGAY